MNKIDSPVTLTTVPTDLEARMIVAALDAQGIEALVTDEFTAGFLPGALQGRVHVVVREDDLELARAGTCGF